MFRLSFLFNFILSSSTNYTFYENFVKSVMVDELKITKNPISYRLNSSGCYLTQICLWGHQAMPALFKEYMVKKFAVCLTVRFLVKELDSSKEKLFNGLLSTILNMIIKSYIIGHLFITEKSPNSFLPNMWFGINWSPPSIDTSFKIPKWPQTKW